MRSGDDRKINAYFLLFRIPVDGREKPFRACALPMQAAQAWCVLAAEFQDKLQASALLPTAEKYAALGDIRECGIDALKAYSYIEHLDKVDWDALSFEQVLDAIEALTEVNDPFVQAQNRHMTKLAEMGERMSTLKSAGVDLNKFMPQQTHSE